jgi:multiple RNA-binding domain-containing protein 1
MDSPDRRGARKRNVPASDDEQQQQQRSYFATRLCVRHLPKGTAENDVRVFLLRGIEAKNRVGDEEGDSGGGGARITDCRVLTKGRECLAFVGVSTPETADRMIERHHRTYLRTFRVVVERAYQKPASKILDARKADEDEDKEKQPSLDVPPTSRKPNILLAAAVATASKSKNKFWANEELLPDSQTAAGEDAADGGSGDDDPNSGSCSESNSSTDEDGDDRAVVKKTGLSDLDFLNSIRRGTIDLEQEGSVGSDREDYGDGSMDDLPGSVDKVGAEEASSRAEPGNESKGSSAEPIHSTDLPSTKAIPLTNRVFVRNLPFTTTEEDLTSFFESVAGCTVVDCHIPVTDQKRSKGFAFVTINPPSDVQAAIEKVDGRDFQGRILHLMPAHPKEEEGVGAAGKPFSFKNQKEEERRKQVGTGSSGGLSSYIRSDAVVDSLASRMGYSKGDILSLRDGLSSGDAAVRLALGETALIEENQRFLERLGISASTLEGPTKRSNTCILVKNLPADTTEEELMKVFGSISSDQPCRLELAPSRTLAVASYHHRNDAKSALRRLAYRRFKSVPLYLEWAPLLVEGRVLGETKRENPASSTLHDEKEFSEDVAIGPTSTVHLKNLSFATTEERLREFFARHVPDVRAVRIPQKVLPARRVGGKEIEGVRSLSQGYGFVEFGSQDSCRIVLKELQGAFLDGHALDMSPSSAKSRASSVVLAPQGKKQLPTKLVVRNVPFQASRRELLVLFGSFGQLRKVRLPKKFDGTHRGFAFVEFMNSKEASAAFKSLSSTHLYGRHLVIERAVDEDEEDIDKLRDKAKRNMPGSSPSSISNSKKVRSS